MTLIVQRNDEGKITRRCDARCHDAKHDWCECICKGTYHGISNNQAWGILQRFYVNNFRDTE